MGCGGDVAPAHIASIPARLAGLHGTHSGLLSRSDDQAQSLQLQIRVLNMDGAFIYSVAEMVEFFLANGRIDSPSAARRSSSVPRAHIVFSASVNIVCSLVWACEAARDILASTSAPTCLMIASAVDFFTVSINWLRRACGTSSARSFPRASTSSRMGLSGRKRSTCSSRGAIQLTV